jgi:hypothetical protein
VIELDRDLAARLRAHPQLSVIESDVLKVDFAQVASAGASKIRVVGNLPYNISSPILFHLLPFAGCIEDQHFMLQKEVIDRMVAQPATADYGRLSVMLQWRYAMENVLTVPPEAFDPPPRVMSAVVRMLPRADFAPIDPALLSELVQVAFSQRRKLLRHTLGQWLDALVWRRIRRAAPRRGGAGGRVPGAGFGAGVISSEPSTACAGSSTAARPAGPAAARPCRSARCRRRSCHRRRRRVLRRRGEQLQDGDVGLARGLVVPLLVAQDDLQQLVHAGRPLALGQQGLGLGEAGVEVALVLGDGRVELLDRPVAALVLVHEAHRLQPAVQRVEAQRARLARQRLCKVAAASSRPPVAISRRA